MYISVPKNYGGNAFPHPDAPRTGGMPRAGGMPRTDGAQPSPVPPPRPMMPSVPSPVAPLGKIPRDLPPPPPPLPPDEAVCAPDAPSADACAPCDAAPCGAGTPPCRAENKNPLTCLFEALHGRKKAGFDADDFLLVGLIALLMGKEGGEDIVLILALLLLV